MAQQTINIGAAPNDGTGDNPRAAFDKSNDNFTELYAKGTMEGLWNYNQTSTDTTTAPVSGRFKTNSGNYRDATQIAIHAVTIHNIDRSSTLRTLLVGDLIQCQDSTNPAAWCRFAVQALPVDHTTWFQVNVVLQADGNVASGDNQEIVFNFTAAATASASAPIGAEYITSTADATLTSERVLTDTATVTWDRTTAGQIKANAAGGSSAANTYGVRGLVGNSTSTTAYAITFLEATLRNSAGNTVLVTSGSFTADSAGAVGANGRDATLADGDLHLYAINGTSGNAGIWSNTAPPTGPTLPSGYTNWCYLTSVKRASGTITNLVMRGNSVYYALFQTVFTGSTATGNATNTTSISTWVPAIATMIDYHMYAQVASGTGATASGQWVIGAVSGSPLAFLQLYTENVSNNNFETQTALVPNNATRAVFFGWSTIASPLSYAGHLYIRGYQVPNGD